ncbi:MAG: hypothetical protein U0441_00745 [Polyangiaceae bacterium]
MIALAAAASACGSTVTSESSAGGSTTTTSGTSTGGSMGGASTGGSGVSGSSTGGGAGGGLTGGGGTGGATSVVCPGYGDACTECLSTGCADTYCACYDEVHCFGYLQCLGTCMMGDAACAQNCATVHEPGISVAILVADCAATTCDADCEFGKALNDCQKCLYTACAPEMNACIADAECLSLVQCLQACPAVDPACSQDCVSAHPDGLAKAQAAGDCRKSQCPEACP